MPRAIPDRKTFQVNSGKLWLVNPFYIGYSPDQIHKWIKDSFQMKPRENFIYFEDACIFYSTDEQGGTEVLFDVVQNGNRIALLNDLPSFNSQPTRKKRVSIPLDKMIGMTGKKAVYVRTDVMYKDDLGYYPYEYELDLKRSDFNLTFTADAENCYLLIGDFKKLRVPHQKWNLRGPNRNIKSLNYVRIIEEYEKILNVSPGEYTTEYHPQFETLVIQPRTNVE